MKSQQFFKLATWTPIFLAIIVTTAVSLMAVRLVNRSQLSAQKTPAALATNNTSLENVAALGYLEPQGEVIELSAPTFFEGVRVKQLLVEQGDKVRAGQVLVILDNYAPLQAALEQARVEVKTAQARLEQVKAGAKKGNIQAQNARFQQTMAELGGQIITQKANIARWEAQLEGKTISQVATIERIKAELNNAQKDCKRYQALYQDGAVSSQEWERICLHEKTTLERLKEAQAQLNLTTKTLQAQIAQAKANLDRTTETLTKQIQEEQAMSFAVAEVRPVDVQVAEAELETAQAAVKKAQADFDLASIRSPRDGRVLKIHAKPSEKVGNEGILEIGQTDRMYVSVEVYETDIGKVRVGQRAKIQSDGIVEELQGTIDEVGLQIGKQDVLGTDPVADADARVVEVKIRLDPEDSQRVAGFTNLQVNVIIDTSTLNKEQTKK